MQSLLAFAQFSHLRLVLSEQSTRLRMEALLLRLIGKRRAQLIRLMYSY